MNVSFVYHCNECDQWTATTPEETNVVCWKCKTPLQGPPLGINAGSVLQDILNGQTDFRKWLKVELEKKQCKPADIDYAFETIGTGS